MADTADLLRDVLARLEALERDNKQLKQENHDLRARLESHAANTVSERDPTVTEAIERMSRRWVLRRGMQAAAASVTAGIFLAREHQHAEADHEDRFHRLWADHALIDILTVNNNRSGALVTATNSGYGAAIRAESGSANGAIEAVSKNPRGTAVLGTGLTGVGGFSSGLDGYGVYGYNSSHVGVLGEGEVGVRGKSSTADAAAVHGNHTGSGFGIVGDGQVGVRGTSTSENYTAVHGQHYGSVGYGVTGDGAGSGAGVLGRNGGANGVGVKGESLQYVGVHGDGRTGVWGTTHSRDFAGVYGETTSHGNGVYGQAPSGNGVKGVSSGGTGVRGEGKTGVYAKSTVLGGYGAVIEGGRAHLRLVPPPSTTTAGPPSGSHQKGEIYLDKNANLWVCTVGGTSPTWKRVAWAP